MKKIFIYILLASFIISCGKSHNGNMIVKGNIEGLKKGTLYLQKVKDTALVSVDSIQLNGESNFTLSDELESPEIYYLTLNEMAKEPIKFFGEKGEITINSRLEKLVFKAEITGSKNQEYLDEHNEIAKKFQGQLLDLIKEKLTASKNDDQQALISIENTEKNLLKRKYLYTTNFALTHANAEVAPYLALTEIPYANVQLLDTIQKSLTKDVKLSKYGKKLETLVKEISKN